MSWVIVPIWPQTSIRQNFLGCILPASSPDCVFSNFLFLRCVLSNQGSRPTCVLAKVIHQWFNLSSEQLRLYILSIHLIEDTPRKYSGHSPKSWLKDFGRFSSPNDQFLYYSHIFLCPTCAQVIFKLRYPPLKGTPEFQ